MTFKKFFLTLTIIYSFFKKKLRKNTISKPKPINPKEKVAKKDNPIINVFKLEEIF